MTYRSFLESQVFNTGHYGVRVLTYYLAEQFRENQELGYKVYDDELNREDSYGALLITTKYDWETKYRGKRPAIFISRGNMVTGANGTVGQGRMLSITENGEATAYMDLVSFPIVVECLAESDIECEALSSIVATYLGIDARPLRSFGMQIQGGITQTPPVPFERGNVTFLSSVIVQIQISRQYKVRVIGNKSLEKIKFMLDRNNHAEITKD